MSALSELFEEASRRGFTVLLRSSENGDGKSCDSHLTCLEVVERQRGSGKGEDELVARVPVEGGTSIEGAAKMALQTVRQEHREAA